MKLKMRLLSIIIAMLLVINSVPLSYASEIYEEVQNTVETSTDKIPLSINTEALEKLTFSKEYGWDGQTYTFDDKEILNGLEKDDENVYLTAKVTEIHKANDVATSTDAATGTDAATSTNAATSTDAVARLNSGTYKIKLSDFSLTGDNASGYEISEDSKAYLKETYENAEIELEITQKVIKIRPQKTTMYYGQDGPENGILNEIDSSYKEQLLEEDKDIEVKAEFKVNCADFSEGTHTIELKGEISVRSGSDKAKNYSFELEDNLLFWIKQYTTEVDENIEKAISIQYDENDTNIVKISTTNGYKVSEKNTLKEDDWEDSITLNLNDIDKVNNYYIRNYNENSEFYKAICYRSLGPTVKYCSIEKDEDTKNLTGYNPNKWYADSKVYLNLEIADIMRPLEDVTVHCNYTVDDGETLKEETEEITLEEGNFKHDDSENKYIAEVSIPFDIPEDVQSNYVKIQINDVYAVNKVKGLSNNIDRILTIDKRDIDFMSGLKLVGVNEDKTVNSDEVGIVYECNVADDSCEVDNIYWEISINGKLLLESTESGNSNSGKIKLVDIESFIKENNLLDCELIVTGKVTVTAMSGATKVKEEKSFVFDIDAPEIEFSISSRNGLIETEKDINEKWFGLDYKDSTLNIEVSDKNSGLSQINVKVNDKEEDGYSVDETSRKTEYTKKLKIEDFSGENTVTVTAVDKCGNKIEKKILFYVDLESPTGSISIATPTEATPSEPQIIDDKLWVDGVNPVVFKIDVNEKISGVKSVELKVNGKDCSYGLEDIQFDEECKGYILLNVTELLGKRDKYTVSGTITDNAMNSTELDELTVYVDYEVPVIEKLIVSSKTEASISAKVLNILSFGIFSNDTIIVTAHVKDAENDSGIDRAVIKYLSADQSTSREEKMIRKRKEYESIEDKDVCIFTAEIPISDNVFAGEISVTVYDRFGKSNDVNQYPKISDEKRVTETESNFVILERIPPEVVLTLEEFDGIERDDGQIWYKNNKEIIMQISDADSGLSNISLKVNDISILQDKNGKALLKSKSVNKHNPGVEYEYRFDTDYLIKQCAETENGEPENGKYTISIEAVDNAGNKTTESIVYYFDDASPSIDSIKFVPKTADGIENTSDFIEKFEYGYYFNTDFNVTINVSDAEPSSGLHEVKYRLVPYKDGEMLQEISGTQKIVDGQATIEVLKGFKGQIFVEAFDNVLNSTGEKTTEAYVVDSIAPNIEITKNISTKYRDANGNSLYTQTNELTVVITDTVSGIKQLGYTQVAELNSIPYTVIDIQNAEYSLDDSLEDGWIITGIDNNLVTQVKKVFSFAEDDNDVILTFDATDNAYNKTENIKSECFTVDKTAPIISVVFREDDDTDLYYNENRIADVTVIERNFDEKLIDVVIENLFGKVPICSFTDKSKTEHTAVITFDEGDYTFDLTGKDLANHAAIVTFSGGNEKKFYVDKSKPVIEHNFAEFNNSHENSFNVDKTANIQIIEHNFDPQLVSIRIMEKAAGEDHNTDDFEDITQDMLKNIKWSSLGNVHTITFTFNVDAVYKIEIKADDLASNVSDTYGTDVFEIDKTVPIVSKKNNSWVSASNTEFLDVYFYSRKDDPAPTVEFDDKNISHIQYKLTTYIPNYSSFNEIVIDPVQTNGTIPGNKYVLPDFTQDGVYTVELIAVDVAGNESALNVNTYARMVNQDVLAYVMESDINQKTGLYSLEDENGNPISKKPSDFDDIKISLLSKKEDPVSIVLRDNDGKEIITNAQYTQKGSVYGMNISEYVVESDFFTETFQNDTDIEMRLTAKEQDKRIDLAKIHIDNIEPQCDISNALTSWQWFFGEEERTVTIGGIDEPLDESACKIYDNGQAIPLVYSAEDNIISFTLAKGWHNVGIVLCDIAGNQNNVQEINNVYIGYFWLWVIIAVFIAFVTAMALIVIYGKNRRKKYIE